MVTTSHGWESAQSSETQRLKRLKTRHTPAETRERNLRSIVKPEYTVGDAVAWKHPDGILRIAVIKAVHLYGDSVIYTVRVDADDRIFDAMAQDVSEQIPGVLEGA